MVTVIARPHPQLRYRRHRVWRNQISNATAVDVSDDLAFDATDNVRVRKVRVVDVKLMRKASLKPSGSEAGQHANESRRDGRSGAGDGCIFPLILHPSEQVTLYHIIELSEVPLNIDFLSRVLTHTTVTMLVISPALTRHLPNMAYLLVIRISP